jgi:dihydrofolate synthase/folylpolyglutamate synthase
MAKNLSEWLTFIEQNYRYLQSGTENNFIKLQQISKNLRLTNFKCPVIIVTGTNGKGSTVKFLETIYQNNNYRVGTYTSPHLIEFNERIRIAGQNVDDTSLCQAFSYLNNKVKDAGLTYFEFVTLAALYLFQKANLDVLILEVGLGGRLDAVNIVDAEVAVITTIALEHTEQLGSTREAIGAEKVRVTRGNCSLVCGDNNPPQSIAEYAKAHNVTVYYAGNDFCFKIHDKHWDWQGKGNSIANLSLPKLPIYNAATALMVVELLQKKLPVTVPSIRKSIKNATLLGRFQQIQKNPTVIVDVAHNPESATHLAQIIKEYPKKGKVFAVVSILKDKDVAEILKPLLPVIDGWYFGSLDVQRGENSKNLAKKLEEIGGGLCYTLASVAEAYQHATKNCTRLDLIIVFGSFYTVAEILKVRWLAHAKSIAINWRKNRGKETKKSS